MTNYIVSSHVSRLALAVVLGCMTAHAATIFQVPQVYDSAGQDSFYVAVVDLNHDGYPDILVGSDCAVGNPCDNRIPSNEISVLLNNGDGTFKPAQTYYPVGTGRVTLGDVNGDGNTDILMNRSGYLGVLLGNGDGTFQALQPLISSGYMPGYITVTDVNSDGHPDVVTVGGSGVNVYLGHGDGTFQAGVSTHFALLNLQSVAIQDVNRDGIPDLVVAIACVSSTDCSGVVDVMLGNGDGTFGPVQTYLSGGYMAMSAAVADLNGDGKPDIVVANSAVSSTDETNGSIGVLLGNGDGTFQSARKYNSLAFATWDVAVADVDGDSIPDVVTSNACHSAPNGSSCSSGAVTVLFGKGDGTFPRTAIYSAGAAQSRHLAVADLNHDGRPDVAVVSICQSNKPCVSGGVSILLNVAKFESSTFLSSRLNPSTYGQSVTLIAKVTSIAQQAPTGLVMFRNGSVPIGSAPITNGMATLVKSNLPAGALSITAIYPGDTTSGKSVSPVLSQTVSQATTSTSIKSSINPSTLGQTITFTVAATSPTAKVTGTVTFTAGTTNLGTVTLTGGKASLAISTLPHGSAEVTATCRGTNFVGSSASLTQVVN